MHAKQSSGVGGGLLSGIHELHNLSLLTDIKFGPAPADPAFFSGRDQSMPSTFAQHCSFEFGESADDLHHGYFYPSPENRKSP
jgi:hypothetical protein